MKRRFFLEILVVALLLSFASAQDAASFEKRITVKKLSNGLTVIVCERPEAPVFSFYTFVNAGSVQDPYAKTGLAHMFEHMAFKGTDTIGTTDYAAEKVTLEKVEKAYAAYLAERDRMVGQDAQKLAQLEKAWKDAIAEADSESRMNSQDRGTGRRRGHECLHFCRQDCLLLLLSFEPAGTLGLPGSNALSAARNARILQRTQRRDRRAAYTRRQQPRRATGGAVRDGRFSGSSVSSAWHRMDVGPEFILGD
jgi:hypothetical protein